MTILDIEPTATTWPAPSVDPYLEAYTSVLWIWDLADLLGPEDLQRLAERLTRLTNDLILTASERCSPRGDRTPVVDIDLGPDFGFKRTPFEDAIGAIQRIEDLAKVVTPEDFGHLAFRLGQITNDIVMSAARARPRPRQDRRTRIYAKMQMWSWRRQCRIA